ncbi:esterase OVCA2 [Eurytemora carolleeae]|uniref:esterase OVCA2 n=1 Tax=Eurytemora carolleeae TaxID=1294199 RepID=UPI000C7876FB|nr:esterase OVCA2 [Eurytemora carolleeae]XP_023330936.1 esterase OVCA2 [Eurytemora carolleeae]|eukprot:XP_023330935.1 esterase OVCA2-like [Eurytemora affinis]
MEKNEGDIIPEGKQEKKEKSENKERKGKEEKRGKKEKEEKNKLRILCLHGYQQSGPVFRTKIGSVRKFCSKLAEFIFITAPHKIADEEYGWWFSQPDGVEESQDTHRKAELEETLKLISETFRSCSPIHGILAFSQGAALGGILCALQEQGKLDFSFKFSILVAGYISRSQPSNREIFDILASKQVNIYYYNQQTGYYSIYYSATRLLV